VGIEARAVVSDTGFRLGVAAAALTLGAIVARVGFCHEFVLPPVPVQPEPKSDVVTVAAASAAVDRDPSIYAETLATDSRALRIDPEVTPDDLSGVFAHRTDTRRRTLTPGRKRARTTEAAGLALSVSVADVEGTPQRQLVLTIENTTRHHLAYRVTTRPSRGLRSCYDKGDLAHNAVALAPGEKVRRSECIYRKGLKLFVDRVDTIRLPRLSYFYVSALPAPALGLDRQSRLAARGHRPAGARSPCRVFHSAELLAALSSGAATWRDLIDFHARHPCGVYSFPINYKAFEADGERPLPAVAPAE
jgi:hypothetical protein